MKRVILGLACLAAAATTAAPASAASVVDATGDFLPGYTGAKLDDLDVTSFSVDYDIAAAEFRLAATFAGAITPGTAGFYVIGVNTGAGAIAPFGGIGQGNVTFDRAIVINKDGTGQLGGSAIDPSRITIAGNSFSALIAASSLPSSGAAPEGYGFNLWPRVGFAGNSQISDFSPENAVLTSGVPEPSTWALMILGFGAAGIALRRRRRAMVAAA